MLKDFFSLLFRESDYSSFGSINTYEVCSVSDYIRSRTAEATGSAQTETDASANEPVNALFFAINALCPFKDHGPTKNWHDALKPRRADLNVIRFQNFLFEIDRLSLSDQMKLIESLKQDNLLATITYSGSKSYHCIVSLQNALDLKPHKQESIDEYKAVWSSIAAYIETRAAELGLESANIIDPACKNPSRLSRIPNVLRPDTGKIQELIYLGNLLSDQKLQEIKARHPVETRQWRSVNECVSVESLEDFEGSAPTGLRTLLENPINWASDNGNYPILYKATLWAIDATNVSKDVLLAYLHKHTFPFLTFKGYPSHKMERAIHHAYDFKKIKD